MQLTLVSHYGPKSPDFAGWIRRAQSFLAARLGTDFRPYAVEQVHATICGLEGNRIGDRIANRNFIQLRGEERFMDMAGLLKFVREAAMSALEVRVGGFDQNADHGFTSAGQHPFERTFAIRSGIVVAMGWPMSLGHCVPVLDDLRRKCQRFGVLHKWHHHEEDMDNDFFFVLGRVASDGGHAQQAAEQKLREQFVDERLTLVLSRETLSLVAYSDPQLPLETSQAFALKDEQATALALASLYEGRNST
jgi:hypothetical protein